MLNPRLISLVFNGAFIGVLAGVAPSLAWATAAVPGAGSGAVAMDPPTVSSVGAGVATTPALDSLAVESAGPRGCAPNEVWVAGTYNSENYGVSATLGGSGMHNGSCVAKTCTGTLSFDPVSQSYVCPSGGGGSDSSVESWRLPDGFAASAGSGGSGSGVSIVDLRDTVISGGDIRDSIGGGIKPDPAFEFRAPSGEFAAPSAATLPGDLSGLGTGIGSK